MVLESGYWSVFYDVLRRSSAQTRLPAETTGGDAPHKHTLADYDNKNKGKYFFKTRQ